MKFVPALTFTLLFTSVSAAQAAPSAAEVEKAAMRVASTLDGVLRNCPASFSKIGTDGKKCVGTAGTVEQVRQKLSGALGADLYSVWRSRDEQRTVYNWLKTPAGYVYVRLQPDPDGRAQTLVYLDVPPESTSAGAGSTTTVGGAASPNAPTAPSTQVGNVLLSPAPTTPPITPPATTPPATTPPAPTDKPAAPATGSATTPTPSTSSVNHLSPSRPAEPTTGTSTKPPTPSGTAGAPSATAILRSLAPVPFSRVLQVQAKRMNGADVMAVQNRLIALMRPARAGKGDGWFGPVTSAAVKAFQAANNLPVTGRVDQATWDALFSPSAKSYTPPSP